MEPQEFFKSHLIPAGQAAEVVVQFVTSFPPRQKHLNDVIQQIREPLNLTAAYATHAKVNNLLELSAILADYVQIVAKKMATLKRLTSGGTVQEALHRCLTNKAPLDACNSRNRQHFINVTQELVAELNHLVLNRLFTAIGYRAHERLHWIQKHSNAFKRPSDWRTFVRNSVWRDTARLLGYQGLAPSTEIWVGSRVGRAQLEQALRHATRWMAVDTSEVISTHSNENAKRSVAMPATTPLNEVSKLPFYIEVHSSKGGMLEVCATYAPANMLSAEQRQKAKELKLLEPSKEALPAKQVPAKPGAQKTPSAASSKLKTAEKAALEYGFPLLATVKEQAIVPWTALASAIEHCQSWYERQPDAQTVRTSFDKALEVKARQDVKAKLVKTFSPEERTALKAMLLEEGHLPLEP